MFLTNTNRHTQNIHGVLTYWIYTARPKNKPMLDLSRFLMDHVGVRTEKIGDSTGKLDGVFKAT